MFRFGTALLASILLCLSFLLVALSFLVLNQSASARSDLNSIAQKLNENATIFESMLNDNTDPKDLMDFLHTTISKDAKIYMVINDPDEKNADTVNVQLSKADYINSYLYGPKHVQNYHVEMKTDVTDINEADQSLASKDIIIETGIIKDPNNPSDTGRDFTSQTLCRSHHTITEQGLPVLQTSHCRTTIATNQDI